MILTKNIDKKDFYYNFYKALNPILNLSKKELAILSNFASIRANLTQDSELSQIQIDAINFGNQNRKLVALKLGISIFNLNNYIKSLKDKSILIINSDRKITFPPHLYPSTIENPFTVQFKFNIV